MIFCILLKSASIWTRLEYRSSRISDTRSATPWIVGTVEFEGRVEFWSEVIWEIRMGMTAVTWLPPITDPIDAVVFVFAPCEYIVDITSSTLLLIQSIKARIIHITKIKELIREGNSYSYYKCIEWQWGKLLFRHQEFIRWSLTSLVFCAYSEWPFRVYHVSGWGMLLYILKF